MIDPQWFAIIDGTELGPLPSSQIKALVEKGEIGPETPVKREGMPSFVPAKQARGLLPAVSSKPPSLAAQARERYAARKKGSSFLPKVLLAAGGVVVLVILATTLGGKAKGATAVAAGPGSTTRTTDSGVPATAKPSAPDSADVAFLSYVETTGHNFTDVVLCKTIIDAKTRRGLSRSKIKEMYLILVMSSPILHNGFNKWLGSVSETGDPALQAKNKAADVALQQKRDDEQKQRDADRSKRDADRNKRIESDKEARDTASLKDAAEKAKRSYISKSDQIVSEHKDLLAAVAGYCREAEGYKEEHKRESDQIRKDKAWGKDGIKSALAGMQDRYSEIQKSLSRFSEIDSALESLKALAESYSVADKASTAKGNPSAGELPTPPKCGKAENTFKFPAGTGPKPAP